MVGRKQERGKERIRIRFLDWENDNGFLGQGEKMALNGEKRYENKFKW